MSLEWCSSALGLAGTETGEHLSGFIDPCALSCRAGGSERACRNQGAIDGSCRLWGGGSPCSALSQEPAQPSVEDKLHIPLCAEGNLSGYILWRMKHEDVLLHSVILRGLAWLMICPLIFHGVCVCMFSLSHFLRVTELF